MWDFLVDRDAVGPTSVGTPVHAVKRAQNSAAALCSIQMAGRSEARRRSKEAAAAAVGSLAAPIGAIGRRLRLGKRDSLSAEQHVSIRADVDLIAWNREAITFAATPFAGGIAQTAAGNPAVVSGAWGTNEEDEDKSKLHPSNKSAH
jgi:hypothetical protein